MCLQVQVFWHWVDYLMQAAVLQGRTPCFINLDETPIPRAATKAEGYVHMGRCVDPTPKRRLDPQLRRGIATHVALIADDTAVQAALPQTFLVNARLFRMGDVPARLPAPRVVFQIGLSAWNTNEKMTVLLESIATAMVSFPAKQAILVLDCAPCHTHWEVIAKANALNVWLLFIPARLTSLLQPLDVSVFARYKARLRTAFLSREANGTLDRRLWAIELGRLVKEYWRANRWRTAFEQVGIGRVSGAVSLTKDLLRLEVVRLTVTEPPSREAIEKVMPKGHRSIWSGLFLRPANLAGVELPELS